MATQRSLHDPDLEADIAVGLVLHLDPKELTIRGATYTCDPTHRVQGQHFFLCVSVNGAQSRWLPLFTRSGTGRHSLARGSRTGHAKWTGGSFHYRPGQVWSASSAAVVKAAARAHDKTRRGSRNQLAAEEVPTV